jgi:hypothetical protein
MNAMNDDASNEELLDLLTERALGELSDEDEARLRELLVTAGLLERAGLRGDDDIDLAAAAAMNAFAGDEGSASDAPVPEEVKAKLHADADRFFAAPDRGAVAELEAARARRAAKLPESAPAGILRSSRAGWMVAAMLAVVVVTFALRPGVESGTSDPAAARAALIAEAGTSMIEWNTSEIPAYNRVTGDVVWNDARQEGYLRLTGMPANDPSFAQYQLWIVDPERDANPVDGGVFNVPPGTSEIIIPIDAKLAVADPAAFAITREQPGGVVVSDGPLLLVAPKADPGAAAS